MKTATIRRPRVKAWSQEVWLGIFLYRNYRMPSCDIAKLLGKGSDWSCVLRNHIMQSYLWEKTGD